LFSIFFALVGFSRVFYATRQQDGWSRAVKESMATYEEFFPLLGVCELLGWVPVDHLRLFLCVFRGLGAQGQESAGFGILHRGADDFMLDLARNLGFLCISG
jgi:hypothetical protein